MNSKKRVLVTCGPIPARVDSVKYLTNMFKGGLAFKTAAWLSGNKDFEYPSCAGNIRRYLITCLRRSGLIP